MVGGVASVSATKYLAAAEIQSEQTHRYVVEMPPVLDEDEWQRKYGQNPSLPPPSRQ